MGKTSPEWTLLVHSAGPSPGKEEGWKPHFCKTTHTQNPQRNTTHRHQPRNSDLFKFFRGRTPGLIAWAVAMNKPGKAHVGRQGASSAAAGPSYREQV
nr:unnamed protein product [Callosobruchus chinensis]